MKKTKIKKNFKLLFHELNVYIKLKLNKSTEKLLTPKKKSLMIAQENRDDVYVATGAILV